MVNQTEKPKSLIQTLLELNEESQGKEKIFMFALIKEESLENHRKQTVKVLFSISTDYQHAVTSIFINYPQFKDYRIIDHIIAHLGANPEKVDPSQKDDQPVPDLVNKQTQIENLFKLFIDDYTETEEEQRSLKDVLQRIRDHHKQHGELT